MVRRPVSHHGTNHIAGARPLGLRQSLGQRDVDEPIVRRPPGDAMGLGILAPLT